MTKIIPQYLGDITDVIKHYPKQNQMQDIYVELDLRDGVLRVDYNAEIGNALPGEVRNGHVQRYHLAGDGRAPTTHLANEILDKLAPIAQMLINTYESKWDGSNHVARYDKKTSEAIAFLVEGEAEGIKEGLDGYGVGPMDDIGYERIDAEDEGLTAYTTDKEIPGIADVLYRDGRRHDQIVTNTIEAVTSWRDELRSEELEDVMDHLVEVGEAAAKRDPLVMKAHVLGATDVSIGEALGLTRAAVGQIRARAS